MDRLVGGVGAGLARHLGIDAALVRLGIIGLSFLGGLGIWLYLTAWLLVPDDTDNDPRVYVLNGGGRLVAGAVMLTAVAVGGVSGEFSVLVAVLLVGAGVLLLSDRSLDDVTSRLPTVGSASEGQTGAGWAQPSGDADPPPPPVEDAAGEWAADDADTAAPPAPTGATWAADTTGVAEQVRGDETPATDSDDADGSGAPGRPEQGSEFDGPSIEAATTDWADLSGQPGFEAPLAGDAIGHSAADEFAADEFAVDAPAFASASLGATPTVGDAGAGPGSPSGQRTTWALPIVERPERAGPRPPVTSVTLGLIALLAGGLALLSQISDLEVTASAIAWLVALGCGVGLLVSSVVGRAWALLPIGLMAAAAAPFATPLANGGVGPREVVVDLDAEVEEAYSVGFGYLELDLSGVDFGSDRTIEIDVGAGYAEVVLPQNVDITASASSTAGYVDLLGAESAGIGAKRTVIDEVAEPRARVEIIGTVTTGYLEVRRG